MPYHHRIPSLWLSRLAGACTVCIGMAAALPAWAMDLREAYQAALENDATIRASRAGAAASMERLPQAQAQRLPNISLSAARNYNDLTSKSQNLLGQPVTNTNQYYSGNQSLTLRQPLYRPYLNAQVRQAEAFTQDAQATLERDEQTLVTRVGESFFDALLARDQLLLVAAQKRNYATQLDAARKGVLAGSGTRTDIDEAQARLDQTLAQELEAHQNVGFTRRQLETLVGRDLGTLAHLDVVSFRPEQPQPASLQAWIDRAHEASPTLHSLRAQVEAAQGDIDKARAGHLPTLDAVVSWQRSNSDSVTSVNSRYDNKIIGLQLSVPLYQGGYVDSTVRQAVASMERAREALEAARLDLDLRVHREFRGMTEGVLRIAALEQAVRSAEQAVASNRKSFEAGSRTNLDVLNAEQQKTMAQRDLAQARYLYLVSRLRLHALAGEDRQTSIAQINSTLAP